MRATIVARGVLHDGLERGHLVLRVDLLARKERRERVLDAFDGLLGVQAFGPGHGDEGPSFLANDPAQAFENIGL